MYLLIMYYAVSIRKVEAVLSQYPMDAHVIGRAEDQSMCMTMYSQVVWLHQPNDYFEIHDRLVGIEGWAMFILSAS